MTNDNITYEELASMIKVNGVKICDMSTYEKYDYMLYHLTDKEIESLDFATSVYGFTDETLSNVLYYYYAIGLHYFQ